MAHDGKKSRPRIKEISGGKKPDSLRSNKKFWAAIIVIALILTAASGWLLTQKNDTGIINMIDRSVHFPKDEGRHSETSETWELYMQFSYENRSMGLYTSYFSDFLAPILLHNQSKAVRLIDETNLTGTPYYSFTSWNGLLEASNNSMDLKWASINDVDRFINTNSTPFSYIYDASSYNNNETIYHINCTLTNGKNPVLWGAQGKIYMLNYGTLYGYFQPRFKLTGTLAIKNGPAKIITGTCWLNHNWGGLSLGDEELFHMSMNNGYDVMMIRWFVNNSGTMGLAYTYYIYPDGRYLLTKWTPDVGDSTILVENAGAIYYNQAPLHIALYNTHFQRNPTDPIETRCYSSSWRLIGPSLFVDTQLKQTIANQFDISTWMGTFTMTGVADPGQNGKGFAYLNHRYQAHLLVTNVTNNTVVKDIPEDPTKIHANVTDEIPITNVSIIYTTNQGPPITIAMSKDPNTNSSWTGTIPSYTIHTKISYRVSALDLSDRRVNSIWYNYTI